MERNIPLWKRSCLEGLDFDTIRNSLYGFAEIDYNYECNSRREDFQIFFASISARAESLLDQIEECREIYTDWNDYTVCLLGGVYRVLGYDAEEEDYYSLFARGFGFWGEGEAVKAATERLMRYKKSELIENWHKVLTLITAYIDLKGAYDGLVSAIDFLENDGLKKSEEITGDIECAYSNLWYSDGVTIDYKRLSCFELALNKTYPEMWIF